MEIIEKELLENSDPKQLKLLELLLEESKSEEEFAHRWLSQPDATITFGTGLDDDNKHVYVCIVPIIAKKELAQIYVSRDTLRSRFPAVRPISDYFKGERTRWLSQEMDDEELAARNSSLKITYHKDLYENIGSFSSVFEFMLSYALDNIGNCTLELVPRDDELFDYDDFEDSSVLEKTLGICHMHYGEEKTGRGFGESCYFTMD